MINIFPDAANVRHLRLANLRYLRSLRMILLMTGMLCLYACSSPTTIFTVTPTVISSPTPTSSPIHPSPTQRPLDSSLTIGSSSRAPHMDVHQGMTESLLSLGPGIVYSRLVRLRSDSNMGYPSMDIECDLCERWEHPDPLTYVFYLRPGILWQNLPPANNRDLTSADVKFSLDRLRTPGWPGASLMKSVKSIESTDSLTITIHLQYPDTDLLVSLANGQSKVVAHEAVNTKNALRDGPTIGTGPWVFDPDHPNEYRFFANRTYYEVGVPQIKELRIIPIPDEVTRSAALFTRRVDLTAVNADTWEKVKSLNHNLGKGVFVRPGTGTLLGLKTTHSPFNQKDIRRAFFQALDPWLALGAIWDDNGSVAVGMPVASADWLLSKKEIAPYLNNPQKAISFLDKADINKPIHFTLTVADFGDRYIDMAKEYSQMLQKVGFATKIAKVNPRSYAEQVWGKGEYQAFLGPIPPVHSTNPFLLGILHSNGRWATTGYKNAELDRLIHEQSTSEHKRSLLVREVQLHVLDNAIMFMPVTGTSLWMWQDRVENFIPNFAASEYFHWSKLQIKSE